MISHPESLGNGAAVKAGARAATGEILAFMDGDGQHDARQFEPLLKRLDEGYHMAIGARNTASHASVGRLFANGLYNGIASMMSGRKILDLTSGFRVARADLFKRFLYLLPNGFSYPTTITMAFLRSGYPVKFEAITAEKRVGKSHIRPIRDGVRFMIIIFKIATLYSPLKDFSTDQRRVFCDRPGLLRLYLFDDGQVHEHEHVDYQRVGHYFLDRTDIRTNHGADIQ